MCVETGEHLSKAPDRSRFNSRAYGGLLFAAPIELHTLFGAAVITRSGYLVLR
jgi:hypothetical protein